MACYGSRMLRPPCTTLSLVEHFSQNMLRKFVAANGKAVGCHTCFLNTGRYPRPPQASPISSCFLAGEGAHVLKMREKMEEITGRVQNNLEQAQTKQKTWYDQTARQRTLEPGQKVLFLLPMSESNLLAKLKGPYSVIRRMGPATYKIELPGKRKPRPII